MVMTKRALPMPEPMPMPIAACTICRELGAFETLIETMEAEVGASWSDFGFDEADAFFQQPESASLRFAVLAVDREDEDDIPLVAEIVRSATAMGVKIVIVARDLGSTALHHLLSLGAEAFVPYPVPGRALEEAIERLGRPAPTGKPARVGAARNGVVLPVHGLAGGVGSTTFAVNLAWELATADRKAPPRVCLLDLDLQFGSVAPHLDLPRREASFELLSDASLIDGDAFAGALVCHGERLHVLPAPAEMLPLDLLSPEDVTRLIATARSQFDYVVIDMPKALVGWSETVLRAAHVYFALLELDLRSAGNALRLVRALKAEDLPVEKLRFVLNRAPGGFDFAGRGRVRRLAEGLDLKIEARLPDGGRAVADAADGGSPLAAVARRNPLRKAVAKLAAELHALNTSAAAA